MIGNPKKFVDMAVFILNQFGSVDDLASLTFTATDEDDDEKLLILSANYPSHKVPLYTKQNFTAIGKKSTSDASEFARIVIRGVIIEYTLAKNNAKALKTKYPILTACYDFIYSLRPFTVQEMHTILGNLHSEVCRSIKEREKKRLKELGKNITQTTQQQSQVVQHTQQINQLIIPQTQESPTLSSTNESTDSDCEQQNEDIHPNNVLSVIDTNTSTFLATISSAYATLYGTEDITEAFFYEQLVIYSSLY